MKKREIHLGHHYERIDKLGRRIVRRVVAEGAEYKLYPSQAETDCLRFVVVEGLPAQKGQESNCTRASFAAWAKADVTESFGGAEPNHQSQPRT